MSVAVSVAATEETIVLGFHAAARREWTRTEVRATFDLWAAELSEKFKIPVRIVHYDDAQEMERDLEAGKLHAVNTDALSFVRYFQIDHLTEGYATVMKGGWDLQLHAGRDTPIRSPADFPGKRVVLLEQDSIGEIWLETLCLRQHARPCAEVFADMQRVPNSNQGLMRLFFGKADMALVHSYGFELAVEMNPQLGQAVRKIAEHHLPSQYFAFYHARVDKGLRQRTLRVIPTLHTYPRGRQLLDLFKMDHLDVASPGDLKPVMELERDYRQLRARGARKVAKP
jgi:ABC-type phosphate/phosphonate transport system substrate-binding protein